MMCPRRREGRARVPVATAIVMIWTVIVRVSLKVAISMRVRSHTGMV
jgi:hypothetical protein